MWARTRIALPALAFVAELTFWKRPQPPSPGQAPRPAPRFDYGIGVVQDVDKEGGVIVIQRGDLTVSHFTEDRGQRGGVRPRARVEFQVLHDGGRSVLTEIRSLDDDNDQAGEPPACE